jgi:hypothetical protein
MGDFMRYREPTAAGPRILVDRNDRPIAGAD